MLRTCESSIFHPCKKIYYSHTVYNDKWLVNLSNVQLPPSVINILRFGDKFNFIDNLCKNNVLEIIKNLEYFLKEKNSGV